MYLQFSKEFEIITMMHVVEKIVHVKIEKLVKTTGETVRRRLITTRSVFVGQRLTK